MSPKSATTLSCTCAFSTVHVDRRHGAEQEIRGSAMGAGVGPPTSSLDTMFHGLREARKGPQRCTTARELNRPTALARVGRFVPRQRGHVPRGAGSFRFDALAHRPWSSIAFRSCSMRLHQRKGRVAPGPAPRPLRLPPPARLPDHRVGYDEPANLSSSEGLGDDGTRQRRGAPLGSSAGNATWSFITDSNAALAGGRMN